MKYAEKFKDPRWQKLRLRILERDKWECQCCSSNSTTLHVHHRYYKPKTEPWDYPESAFITLCEDCHREETEERKGAEVAILSALREKFLYNQLYDLAASIHRMDLLSHPETVAEVYCWALETPEIQKELTDRHFDQT